MLSRFVITFVECRGGRVWVFWVVFLQCGAWWILSVGQCGSDGQVHVFEVKMYSYIPVVFKLLVWCVAEVYVSGLQDAALLTILWYVWYG